jgi:hypothetical protein
LIGQVRIKGSLILHAGTANLSFELSKGSLLPVAHHQKIFSSYKGTKYTLALVTKQGIVSRLA